MEVEHCEPSPKASSRLDLSAQDQRLAYQVGRTKSYSAPVGAKGQPAAESPAAIVEERPAAVVADERPASAVPAVVVAPDASAEPDFSGTDEEVALEMDLHGSKT